MHRYHFDGHKGLWHMDRIYDHFRDGKRIYPLHIDIGATKICNAKCVYCYGIKQGMDYKSIIPRHAMLDVFGTAKGLGIHSVTVTGDGEPTLNPYLYEAVALGKSKGLDIGIATNGIAISMEQMDTLLKSCTWIRFNLSAVDREGYKKVHTVDKWEAVERNIKLAVMLKRTMGYSCTIGLQMVLVPQCMGQVIPEAQFAVDTGVDYFVIKQFSDPGCSEMSRFDLSLYDSDKVKSVLQRAEALSTPKTAIVPKYHIMALKGSKPYDRCVDCALLFQSSGTGKCYPCGYLFGDDRYCYGDLHKQTLKEILDSEKYWSIISYMRNSFNVHTDCFGCCRHDALNAFIWEYLHPPSHINFI